MTTKKIVWGRREGEHWEIDEDISIDDDSICEKYRILAETNKSCSIPSIPFKKIKLTYMNAHEYIGYKIEFTSKKCVIVKRIMSVASSGKSIRIDYPYLKNCLVVGCGRKIYVIGA